MALYIDKYSPKSFDDFTYNKEIITTLKSFANHDNISHIILSGAEGCGKNTIANLFINYKYGKLNHDKEIVRHTKKYEIRSKDKVIKVISSNHHFQLNPSTRGVYDRIIIKEFINDIVEIKPIMNNYITFIIEDADKLTIDAQESLRRTLEKYINSCRFIFLVNNTSSIIPPLLSRFIKINLASPNDEDILKILKNIDNKEGFNTDIEVFNKIIKLCDRNLRKAINYLQSYHINNNLQDYELNNIDSLVHLVLQSINNDSVINIIEKIREILYILLVHCTDPFYIAKQFYFSLKDKINEKNIDNITSGLITCLSNLRNCNKPIYHLEQYIIYCILAIN